jgi:hypothetical protein
MQKLHCQGCGRCVLHFDMDALKPGKRVSHKCRCGTVNMLTGKRFGLIGESIPADDTPGPARITEAPDVRALDQTRQMAGVEGGA